MSPSEANPRHTNESQPVAERGVGDPVSRPLHAVWLGQRDYSQTYALQQQLHEFVKTAPFDVALLLEHDACLTLGKSFHAEHLLASPALLQARGVSVHQTDRGGDITLHAPGQLVAYPIVNLNHSRKDVRRYVNALTRSMQDLVGLRGISAGTFPGMIGLWTDGDDWSRWQGPETAIAPTKLGAIGVRISRWVTMHGFALNLTTDLSLFTLIVPCGISEYPVASVASLTGEAPTPAAAAPIAHAALARNLQLDQGLFRVHVGALTLDSVLESLRVGPADRAENAVFSK